MLKKDAGVAAERAATLASRQQLKHLVKPSEVMSEVPLSTDVVGVNMRRYCVCKAEGALDESPSWLVLDTQTNFIARMNEVWLDMPTKVQAERFAERLNRLHVEKQRAMCP